MPNSVRFQNKHFLSCICVEILHSQLQASRPFSQLTFWLVGAEKAQPSTQPCLARWPSKATEGSGQKMISISFHNNGPLVYCPLLCVSQP